jgi:zinc protease
MSDIENITRDDLKKHYDTYYAPNNATIVVVGDVNAKEIFKEVNRYFGALPRGKEINPLNEVEPPQRGMKKLFVVSREARIPFLMLAFHTPTIGSGEEYPLEIMTHILGEGKSSRLYKRLVYDEKAAVFTSAHYQKVSKDPGLLYLYAGLIPEKSPEEVETMIKEEIERINKGDFTEKELEKAKNQVKASFVYGLDSNFYRAMNIGRLETIGIGYKYLDTYLNKIGAVTRKDILKVAHKYLKDTNLTVGILIPEGEK